MTNEKQTGKKQLDDASGKRFYSAQLDYRSQHEMKFRGNKGAFPSATWERADEISRGT
jgi:hypothetical protein